jgi:hypothetical protein
MSVDTFLAEYEQTTEPVFTREPGEVVPPCPYQRYYNGNVELHVERRNDAAEDPYIHLWFIGSHERGKGHGSAALTWLCDLADRHNVLLAGNADAKARTLRDMLNRKRTPGLNQAQLRGFYERHGFRFQLSDGTPTRTFFYREPKTAQPA